MNITVSGLARYPVKSARGEAVSQAAVEPWGLAGDRRWMVVDDQGGAVTAREVNRLLLVHPLLTGTGLRLTAPGAPVLDVVTPDAGLAAHRRSVVVWGSRLDATAAGPQADAWFSDVLARPARLVWLDDPTRRATDPDFGAPGDRVSFADGYPLLAATEASLAALNDEVLARAAPGREPLPMTRFRPNVVLEGTTAWAEDDWRRIRIGDVVFRAVKGCARCVLTTIDPDTAEREREPIASLARIRRWDGATWFGVNLVPELAADQDAGRLPPRIRVGDDVEVLDAVGPGAGPLRAATRNPVVTEP